MMVATLFFPTARNRIKSGTLVRHYTESLKVPTNAAHV